MTFEHENKTQDPINKVTLGITNSIGKEPLMFP